MATRIVTTHTDDIDGSEDATNVTFSLDGTHYEIDLSEQHHAELREALAPYVGHARKVTAPQGAGGARRIAPTAAAAGRDYDPKAVRAWATEKGIEVPARGRVPQTVIESYREAQSA